MCIIFLSDKFTKKVERLWWRLILFWLLLLSVGEKGGKLSGNVGKVAVIWYICYEEWKTFVFYNMVKLIRFLMSAVRKFTVGDFVVFKLMLCSVGMLIGVYFYDYLWQNNLLWIVAIATVVIVLIRLLVLGKKSWLFVKQKRWPFDGHLNMQINQTNFRNSECQPGVLCPW